MRYLYYSIWLSIAISFLCVYGIGNAQTLNTGNVLTNSTFGTGENTTTTGWSTDGDHGIHTHGEWGFPYQTGMDDNGGVLAFEGHEEDNVYQDVDLVGDGHLTQQQINQGFTSTMAADVWFWNNSENKLTLKQTVTGSDGSVSTQIRDINDHDPSRTTNDGQFTNYTNVYIQGSNTQRDFTIRAELYNDTAGTAYDNAHRGPDVDNVTLDIAYRDIPPINDDAQQIINDIDENIIDIVDDIPEEFKIKTEDLYIKNDFNIVQEDNYFKEDFKQGIETTEFFEEMPKEEFNDKLTEESFEEFEKPLENISTEEEGVSKAFEDEEKTMEEPIEEEKKVASNETEDKTEEEKSDSEGAEESEVQAEENGEQETVQSEDTKVDTESRIATNVANIIKEVTQTTKEVTQNLSKEDLFFKDNSLDAYKDILFYSAKDIYENASMGLFLQIDLSSYSKEIYVGASLSSYTQNDPVEVHRVKLLKINKAKNKILAELEALRQ